MLLAVDIGNTNVTVGLYENDLLQFVFRLATDRQRTGDQYAVEFFAALGLHGCQGHAFEGAIISSVVPELTDELRQAVRLLTKQEPLVLGPGVKTGLNIRIDDPAQLGADMVATAVGAVHRYALPCIICDLGTATKLSVVDEGAVFLGGIIAPGVRTSLNALSQNASQLPCIPLNAPKYAIGTNTLDCMQSGSVLGTAAMLDGLCTRIEAQLGRKAASVVATGGLSGAITNECVVPMTYDPHLLLDGLTVIFHRNVKA